MIFSDFVGCSGHFSPYNKSELKGCSQKKKKKFILFLIFI